VMPSGECWIGVRWRRERNRDRTFSEIEMHQPSVRCLSAGVAAAVVSAEWRDALWAKFFLASLARRQQPTARSSIVKRA
jgi:hypothetical protein